MSKLISAILLSIFFVSPVFAHSGHDHNHPSANLIHFLWLAPLFVAAIIAYSHAIKKSHFKNFESPKTKKELEE